LEQNIQLELGETSLARARKERMKKKKKRRKNEGHDLLVALKARDELFN
jgi:hypothetical protein